MNLLDSIEGSAIAADLPSAKLKWSENQDAVFEAVKTPENILIQAVAGSGKSTTIIEATKHAPGSSLFMAFNKAIAQDIERKGPAGDVKTLNALGHRIVLENHPAQLNAYKTRDVLKTMISDQEFLREHGYTLSRAVGLAKNNCFGIGRGEGPEEFSDLIEAYFDVNSDQLAMMGELAYTAFTQTRNDTQTFDFDDQLYWPVYNGWEFPLYDNIFVDECQDLSPIQHMMLDRLSYHINRDHRGRIVAVGDRHQAIYGFRGAASNSMELLKKKFSMIELPLSTTFRCAQDIVKEAQFYNPQIQAREGAPQGEVWDVDRDPNLWVDGLIICRNNAPLFKAILRHVRAKSPCRVLSNFLDSFQGFVRSFKTTYTSELRDKLDQWYLKEKAAAERLRQMGKLDSLKDKYETVKLLSLEFKQTQDVIRLVERLGQGTSGPTFATVHKSKGLENQMVYILRPDLMPAFYAQTEDQKRQENNLIYVAITRAKESLIWGERLS